MKYKYRLNVSTGYYESNSFFRLLIEMFKHRCWHLYKHRKWID